MYSANSLTFGAARARYGAVPDVPRRVRRAITRWLAAIRQALILRCLDALVRLCRAASVAPRIDTSPLARAAQQQEKTAVVLQYQTADASPATPLITQQPAVAVFWAGRSDTPGLANTIKASDMPDLDQKRKEHPEWFPGSSARWNGRTAQA